MASLRAILLQLIVPNLFLWFKVYAKQLNDSWGIKFQRGMSRNVLKPQTLFLPWRARFSSVRQLIVQYKVPVVIKSLKNFP